MSETADIYAALKTTTQPLQWVGDPSPNHKSCAPAKRKAHWAELKKATREQKKAKEPIGEDN
jgi:hypothetical protein